MPLLLLGSVSLLLLPEKSVSSQQGIFLPFFPPWTVTHALGMEDGWFLARTPCSLAHGFVTGACLLYLLLEVEGIKAGQILPHPQLTQNV